MSQRSRASINKREQCAPGWRHLTGLGTAGRRAGGKVGTLAGTAPGTTRVACRSGREWVSISGLVGATSWVSLVGWWHLSA